MNRLREQKPMTIIVTSATLSPLHVSEKELGIDFPIQSTVQHSIPKSQVLCGYIEQTNDKAPIVLTKDYCENNKNIQSVGHTLCALLDVIPSGVLIFASSYKLVETCKQVWNKSDILEKMKTSKYMIFDTSDSNTAFKEYNMKVKNKRGAAMMTVMRGRASEGMNFNDDKARAIIILGTPH